MPSPLRATNRRARICSFMWSTYCVTGVATQDHHVTLDRRDDNCLCRLHWWAPTNMSNSACVPDRQDLNEHCWSELEQVVSHMQSHATVVYFFSKPPKHSLLLCEEIGIRNNNDKHRELPFYNTKFLAAERTGHHRKTTWWSISRLRTHQLSNVTIYVKS